MVELDSALRQFGLPPLPKQATRIYTAFHTGGADPALWLRFDVTAEQLAHLISDWEVQTSPSQGRVVRNYTGSELEWWKPDALNTEIGIREEFAAPRRHVRHLLTGQSPEGGVRVYAFVVGH